MHIRKIKILFILVMSVFILSGCSSSPKNVDPKIILGKYVANHEKGIDELEIKADGTYKYYFKSNGGREITNSGAWELESKENDTYITFNKFIFGLYGYGSKEGGFWIVKLEKKLSGKFQLCIDGDLDYYYIQVQKNL